MNTTTAILTRTETGYASKDGRWTVEPIVMGTGQAGGRWSNGRKEWRLTDTHGKAELRRGANTVVVDTLWRVREIIAAHESKG